MLGAPPPPPPHAPHCPAAAAQASLLRFVHSSMEPSLGGLAPLPLATMLWAYGVLNRPADWTDALLQQVGGWARSGWQSRAAACVGAAPLLWEQR